MSLLCALDINICKGFCFSDNYKSYTHRMVFIKHPQIFLMIKPKMLIWGTFTCTIWSRTFIIDELLTIMKTGRRNACEPAALVFLKCEIHVAVKRLYHPRATLDCSRKMCPKVFKSLTLVELGRILLLPSLYKAQPCIQWLIVLGNSYCGYGLSN